MATDERLNKYKVIFQHLYDAILRGKYTEGQRIPSEAQLSRTFGSSRLTAGRALKELEIAGMVERRAGSGSYVKPMGTPRGRTFGLLIPELGQTEIFEPMCQGMARASRATQDELIWGAATRDVVSPEQQALQLCRHYVTNRVSGVFFAPLEHSPDGAEVNASILDDFSKAAIPVVLLDRDVCAYPKRSHCDLVGIDNRRAGYLVTEYLLTKGCQRLVFLARPDSAPTVLQRIAGYKEAARQCQDCGVEFGNSECQDWINELINRHKPDAFVCANDRIAAEVMKRLHELHVDVPGRVKITGMDDAKYSNLLSVPLTTIRQPCHDLGVAAVWTMLDRIAHPAMPPRDVLLNCQLIVRRSCGGAG